jgi:hypothetical protein
MRTPTPPNYKRDDKRSVQIRRVINTVQILNLAVSGRRHFERLAAWPFLNALQRGI